MQSEAPHLRYHVIPVAAMCPFLTKLKASPHWMLGWPQSIKKKKAGETLAQIIRILSNQLLRVREPDWVSPFLFFKPPVP